MKNVFYFTVFLFCCSLANGQDDVLNDFTDYTDTALNMNIEMIAVRGGAFTMGCTREQGRACKEWEKPAHQVTVSDFYIGKYEVTQAQWLAIMGTSVQQQRDKTNTGWIIVGEGNNYPMYYISWREVRIFIRRLNIATGKNYRLPTEAEWEFAARGGNKSKGYRYSGSNSLKKVAWYLDNSGNSTQPVGTKSPNELGIYDMSGNVYEWCDDWFDLYNVPAPAIPPGPFSGLSRMYRGGSWIDKTDNTRVSFRLSDSPDNRYSYIGFRLACSSTTVVSE